MVYTSLWLTKTDSPQYSMIYISARRWPQHDLKMTKGLDWRGYPLCKEGGLDKIYLFNMVLSDHNSVSGLEMRFFFPRKVL